MDAFTIALRNLTTIKTLAQDILEVLRLAPQPLAAYQIQDLLATRPDGRSLTVKLYQLAKKGTVHIVGHTVKPGQGPRPFATYSLTAAPNPR